MNDNKGSNIIRKSGTSILISIPPQADKNQNDKSKVKNVWAKKERLRKKQRKIW